MSSSARPGGCSIISVRPTPSSPVSSISCSTRPIGCSTWDFFPTSGACCATFRAAGRRCFSARPSRRRLRALSREMLRDPATINLERRAAPAVGITHAVYPVPQHLKPALLVALLKTGEHERRARVHADQAPGRPAGEASGPGGREGRADPREPIAAAADRSAGRLQERQVPGARRHRYCGARHRRHRARARRQLRRAASAGQTTSTAWVARRERRRRAPPSRWYRRRKRTTFAESRGRSGSGCRVSRCRTSTTTHAMKRVSRSRWPTGLRPSARESPQERAQGRARADRRRSAEAGRSRIAPRPAPGGGAPGSPARARPRRPWDSRRGTR